MMPIDEQQMRAIAFLAARCRPTGSKPWDEAGIVANLRKVGHISLPELTMAAVRAAANAKAESPGVIPNLTGEHWRDRGSFDSERRKFKPPRKDEECPKHPGWYAGFCGGCESDRRADDLNERTEPMTKQAALAAARAALSQREGEL